MPRARFNPTKDIPPLTGKIILVTGGTAGLGAASVLELAKHNPSYIVFTGRNQDRAKRLIAKITRETNSTTALHFIPCDISSFASVRAVSTRLMSIASRLDIVILNAGVMATPADVSVDGYQEEFATNHLGHALMLDLLLPLLRSTATKPDADVRIVFVASTAYKQAPSNGIDFASLKTSQDKLGNPIFPGHRWSRYGQSKLAQLLYARELARHYPDLTSVCVHPGYFARRLFERRPFLTALPLFLRNLGRGTKLDEGHYNQCWAATCAKGWLKNGSFYEPVGVLTQPATKQALDDNLAAELWNWTSRQFVS